jgi:hypothetical protein
MHQEYAYMFRPYQHFRRPTPLSLHQVLAELRLTNKPECLPLELAPNDLMLLMPTPPPPLKALFLIDALHSLTYKFPRSHYLTMDDYLAMKKTSTRLWLPLDIGEALSTSQKPSDICG